jgi:hypothetical protein
VYCYSYLLYSVCLPRITSLISQSWWYKEMRNLSH